jgi:hypothetical protein
MLHKLLKILEVLKLISKEIINMSKQTDSLAGSVANLVTNVENAVNVLGTAEASAAQVIADQATIADLTQQIADKDAAEAADAAAVTALQAQVDELNLVIEAATAPQG